MQKLQREYRIGGRSFSDLAFATGVFLLTMSQIIGLGVLAVDCTSTVQKIISISGDVQ